MVDQGEWEVVVFLRGVLVFKVEVKSRSFRLLRGGSKGHGSRYSQGVLDTIMFNVRRFALHNPGEEFVNNTLRRERGV